MGSKDEEWGWGWETGDEELHYVCGRMMLPVLLPPCFPTSCKGWGCFRYSPSKECYVRWSVLAPERCAVL